jgi:hypothetical protein
VEVFHRWQLTGDDDKDDADLYTMDDGEGVLMPTVIVEDEPASSLLDHWLSEYIAVNKFFIFWISLYL